MSLKITCNDLQNTKDRIFLILGSSRSGSTLLQSMLSSHTELVVPPETHFFYSYRNLKKEFEQAHNKDFYRTHLIDFWYSNKTRIRDIGLSKEQVLAHAKTLNLHDPLDLFTLQLTLYRAQRQKPIVGEKTPRHMLHIPEILDAYPNAKIIALFRDPRAAAYSEIKAKFGSPSVLVTTKRWRKYVRLHERFEKALPDHQYLMLRYKDLISDVEATLRKTCTFLGVPFEEQMLKYYTRNETGFAVGEKSWKKQTLNPIQDDKNKEWKSSLSSWQITLIEDSADRYLERMKYQQWAETSLLLPSKIFYWFVDFGRSVWATITRSRKEGYIDPNTFKL